MTDSSWEPLIHKTLRNILRLVLLFSLTAIFLAAARPPRSAATCAREVGPISADEFCGGTPLTYCQFRCLNCGGAGCERCSCRLDTPDDQTLPGKSPFLEERALASQQQELRLAPLLRVPPYSNSEESPVLDWTAELFVPPPRRCA